MSIEIRPLRADEIGQLGEMGAYAYAGAFGDGPDNITSASNLPEWTLCAMDNGRLLSSFCAIPFTMRANGKAMAMAGVTTIGTFPEFRRQGLVRRIHTAAFERMREQGQAVASLWASQAAIYQRYGYAQTSVLRDYQIDTVDVGFFDGDNGRGDVKRYSVGEGFALAKTLYIEFIGTRTGYLHRAKALWQNGPLQEVAADGPVHIAVSYNAAGDANGYLIYTLRADKVAHSARAQEIKVRDFVWLDQDAYRSLWQWLSRHDLAGRIHWHNAPQDDPATALFLEPRLLHCRDTEGVWSRIVDVEVALSQRGYDSVGELTLQIAGDQIAPWNNGVWQLTVDALGAQVASSSRSADLTLDIRALSALMMGAQKATRLAAWGLVQGTQVALQRADALFATRHAAHFPDHF